jgi:hypothetical protein
LSIALALVFVASTAQVPIIGSPGPLRLQNGGLTPSDASSTAVQFSVDLLNFSSFTISLGFSANVALSGGSVSAGENVTATASLLASPQANLNISYLGTPVALPIDPLGNLYEVPIPGLSYGYEGIAQLGLFLNLSGVVLGSPNVSGPATINGSVLTWATSATQDVNLTVSPIAQDGSTVTWTLGGISYGLSIGIDAVGSVLGFGVTVPLLEFGSVGLFPGVPSSSSSSYSLPSSSSGSPGGLASLPGSAFWVGLAFILILVVAIVLVVLAVVRRSRARKPPSPP